MKRISIGLFALLAVVFAATSAFTAKAPVFGQYEIWVFDQSFVAFPSQTSPADRYDELVTENPSKTIYQSTSGQTIEDLLSIRLAECQPSEGQLCAVKVDNSGETVEDILDGAYSE